MTYST